MRLHRIISAGLASWIHSQLDGVTIGQVGDIAIITIDGHELDDRAQREVHALVSADDAEPLRKRTMTSHIYLADASNASHWPGLLSYRSESSRDGYGSVEQAMSRRRQINSHYAGLTGQSVDLRVYVDGVEWSDTESA